MGPGTVCQGYTVYTVANFSLWWRAIGDLKIRPKAEFSVEKSEGSEQKFHNDQLVSYCNKKIFILYYYYISTSTTTITTTILISTTTSSSTTSTTTAKTK